MKDTIIRLCLEFDDNVNYFFYGDLKENGDCVINIPKLKNIEQEDGKLIVEALADSIYFKVYEATVEFKNSVEVSMQKPTIMNGQPKTKIEVEQVVVEESKNVEPKGNPFIPKAEKQEKPDKPFSKFDEFVHKKRT